MIELSSNISEYIQSNFGNDFLTNYKLFVESKYQPYIRIAVDDKNIESLLDSLTKQGIVVEQVPEIPKAYRVLEGSEIIGKTVEHTLGKYYVQSLSSMIPPIILNPNSEDTVMDLCAAPGSKSTQLSELMNYEGTLYSNEPSLNRVKALIHNLDKMNSLNMAVIKNKGELLSKKFPNYFDKILVDAPCSALGVVQKKQEVSNWWNSNSVDKISQLQLKLLISAIKMAKVGAELVYSTCTLTIEENEYVVNKVLEKYPVKLVEFDLKLPHIPGFTKSANYEFDESLRLTKRIIPWEIKSEGFFVAKFIKTEETENKEVKNYDYSSKTFVTAENKKIKKYLRQLTKLFGIDENIWNNYKFLINNNDINFTDKNFEEYSPDFFMRIGTKFGIVDKNDNLKLHSHAAQILGKLATTNIYELRTEDELKIYFAGGNVIVNDVNVGQKIIKYKNYYLGTAIVFENKLKSQFPRSKRTGNITL